MAEAGYKQLISYKLAQIAFDLGWDFVPRYYPKAVIYSTGKSMPSRKNIAPKADITKIFLKNGLSIKELLASSIFEAELLGFSGGSGWH